MTSEPGSTMPSRRQVDRDRSARIQLARAAGLALLEVSAGLEDGTIVTRGAGAMTLAIVGFAARGRRLLRAAYFLLDQDHAPEAVPLLRTASEYLITMRWLLLDPEKNLRLLAESDVAKSLLIDARVYEHGGFRLMSDETREFYQAAQAHLKAHPPGEAGAEENDLFGVAGKRERLPTVERMAELVDLSFAYNSAYRLDSQSAVHATAMAINNAFDEVPEGHLVRPVPQLAFSGIDSYALGAFLLLDLLTETANRIPELGWETHLDLIRDNLTTITQADPKSQTAMRKSAEATDPESPA
jgi:hypothetical protein